MGVPQCGADLSKQDLLERDLLENKGSQDLQPILVQLDQWESLEMMGKQALLVALGPLVAQVQQALKV